MFGSVHYSQQGYTAWLPASVCKGRVIFVTLAEHINILLRSGVAGSPVFFVYRARRTHQARCRGRKLTTARRGRYPTLAASRPTPASKIGVYFWEMRFYFTPDPPPRVSTCMQSPILCRICHGNENTVFTHCMCRGNTGAVHVSCCVQWARERTKTRYEMCPWTHCEICGSRYGPTLARKMTRAWINDVQMRSAHSLEYFAALVQKCMLLYDDGHFKSSDKLSQRILTELLQEGNFSEEVKKVVHAFILKHERMTKKRRVVKGSTRESVEVADERSGEDYVETGERGENATKLETWRRRMTQSSQSTPEWLESGNKYAYFLQRVGRHEESIDVLKRVCLQANVVLGAIHRDTATYVRNLAIAYTSTGNYEESEKQMSFVVSKKVELYGAEHHQTVSSILDLVEVLRRGKKYEECARWQQKAVEARSRRSGSGSLLHSGAAFFFSMLCLNCGQIGNARESLRQLRDSTSNEFQKLGAHLSERVLDQDQATLQKFSEAVCEKFMTRLESAHYTRSALLELERHIYAL